MIIQKFSSPRNCYQIQQSLQGITFHTKDRHKMCDHSRANLSPEEAEEEEATLLSCQLAFLAEASKNSTQNNTIN